MKAVLYYLLFATTAIRLIDIIALMANGGTTLPVPVLLVSGLMVLYGIALIAQKFLGAIRVKQFMSFYLVHAVLVVFNLAYVAIAYPLQLSFFEIIAVGSFLDILLDICVVYYCARRMRPAFVPVTSVPRRKTVKDIA